MIKQSNHLGCFVLRFIVNFVILLGCQEMLRPFEAV